MYRLHRSSPRVSSAASTGVALHSSCMLRSQISSETERSPRILEGQKVKKGCFLKEWQETQ